MTALTIDEVVGAFHSRLVANDAATTRRLIRSYKTLFRGIEQDFVAAAARAKAQAEASGTASAGSVYAQEQALQLLRDIRDRLLAFGDLADDEVGRLRRLQVTHARDVTRGIVATHHGDLRPWLGRGRRTRVWPTPAEPGGLGRWPDGSTLPAYGDLIDAPRARVRTSPLHGGTTDTPVGEPWALSDDISGVAAGGTRLPGRALAATMATVEPDSPLVSETMRGLVPEVQQKVVDTLVRATARGQNPVETARVLRRIGAYPLRRALLIARTEGMRAWRTSALAEMRFADPGIVSSWTWWARTDPRTCPACFAMHGTIHKLEERMDTHPACRCIPIPNPRPLVTLEGRRITLGRSPSSVDPTDPSARIVPGVKPGREVFAGLSEAQQRMVLGPGKFRDYSRGRTTLDDYVAYRDSPRWGRTLRVARRDEAWAKGEARRAAERAERMRAAMAARPKPPDWRRLPRGRDGMRFGAKAGFDDFVSISGVDNLTAREMSDLQAYVPKALGPNPRVHIRIDNDAFTIAMKDGRLKSQFETGHSNGALAPDFRAAFEERSFGYAKDVDDKLRPVYGYVRERSWRWDRTRPTNIDPASWMNTENGGAAGYGDVILRLRPDVNKRTTWTTGDSLGAYDLYPSLVSRPKWYSLDVDTRHNVLSGAPPVDVLERNSYVEAQVHGGVRLRDISDVVVGRRVFTPILGPNGPEGLTMVTRVRDALQRAKSAGARVWVQGYDKNGNLLVREWDGTYDWPTGMFDE